MSLYTTNANQKRSKHSILRAIAPEFVPNPPGSYMLQPAEEPPDPFRPLVVTSPTFRSTKDWNQDQMRRRQGSPQPLVSASSSEQNAFAARRTRWGIQHARCTLQIGRERQYKLFGRSSKELVPYWYSTSDRPLYGISPQPLRPTDPFHEQIERIDQHRQMANRGSIEVVRTSYDCRSFSV
jgi:hypothetical protein